MAVDYDLGTARGRIEIDSSQLGRTSDALRTVGRGMIGLGVAAGAGFALVVKSAADFEHTMSAVKAVTNASASEMALLEEQALQLGSTTVFSAGEIGGAMEALGKAGIPVEDMLNGATEATVNLAAAAGDELPGGVERAAEVIANAMKTFNASADEMDHFADVLVGAAASSTISVEDMANSFRYAGPIASQLGLSIDDLSTVLAILGDRGIKGSTAGTSLRGVLLSLTPSSNKARDAMKELGLITEDGTNRFYDLHGNLKPMPEVMQLLGDATKDLSEQEKVAAFNAIFQRRAMNSALILAESGEQGFRDYAEAIGAIDASDVAATKLDNLSGDMTILRNSIEVLMIRAGRPLQDMLRGWVQAITDVVNSLSNLDPETLALITQILGISAAVLITLGSFILFASWLIRMYRTVLIVKEAIVLLAGAFKLAAASFLLNPVVLLIAAIIALGVALYVAYQRSEEFREAVDTAFDHIQPTIEAIVGWVQNFVSLLDDLWRAFQQGGIEGASFADVLDRMGLNGEAVQNFLIGLRDALIDVRDAAVAAFDWIASNVLPVLVQVGVAIVGGLAVAIGWIIGTAIPAIVNFGLAVGRVAMSIAGWINDHVVPVFAAFAAFLGAQIALIIGIIRFLWPAFEQAFRLIGATVQFLVAIIQTAVQAIIIAWTYLGDNLMQAVSLVWNFIKGVIEGALSIIQGIFQVFAGIFTLNWSMVWQGIQNIVSGAWQIITTIIGTAIDLIFLIIETAVDLIVASWRIAWNTVSNVLSAAWNFMMTYLSAIWQTIQGLWDNFLNLIKSAWNAAWSTVRNILQSAWNAILRAISSAISSVMGFITALPGRITGALSGFPSLLMGLGRALIDGLRTAAQNAWSAVNSWLGGIPDAILGAIGDLGSVLFDAGRELVQGLIDGLDSMLGPLDEVVGGIASTVGDFLPGSPVKKGPLRVFNRGQVGKELMRMLIGGIASEQSTIARQMSNLAALTSGPLSGLPGGGVNNTSAVNIKIEINGARDGNDVRAAFDGGLLDEIMAAAKAGRRF